LTETFPAPLTPADCDLSDFPRMMIDIRRLRTSAFDGIADDAAWRAGLNLWMSGFHSVPAAALDDDEGSLCKAAGLGRDVKMWRKIKTAAMRGWVLCSDGRWYHETVAEFVLEAWIGKLTQRLSSGAGNAKRHGTEFDPEPVRLAIVNAAALLTALNPASKTLPKASSHISRQAPVGTGLGCRQEPDAAPTGSQETGTGTGIKKQKEAPLRGPEVSPPKTVPIQIPEWMPEAQWQAFVAMRHAIKKPLTDYATKLLIGKLVKLRTAGNDVAEVLDASILNQWQDVYPPKTEGNARGNSAATSFGSSMERVVDRRAAERLLDSGDELDSGNGEGRRPQLHAGESRGLRQLLMRDESAAA
jgi:hypothetical protein